MPLQQTHTRDAQNAQIKQRGMTRDDKEAVRLNRVEARKGGRWLLCVQYGCRAGRLKINSLNFPRATPSSSSVQPPNLSTAPYQYQPLSLSSESAGPPPSYQPSTLTRLLVVFSPLVSHFNNVTARDHTMPVCFRAATDGLHLIFIGLLSERMLSFHSTITLLPLSDIPLPVQATVRRRLPATDELHCREPVICPPSYSAVVARWLSDASADDDW